MQSRHEPSGFSDRTKETSISTGQVILRLGLASVGLPYLFLVVRFERADTADLSMKVHSG